MLEVVERLINISSGSITIIVLVGPVLRTVMRLEKFMQRAMPKEGKDLVDRVEALEVHMMKQDDTLERQNEVLGIKKVK